MIIKKYRCKKCGSQDFFLAEDAMPHGIYCNDCGKWLKWANRDERNLFLKLHLNAEYGKLAKRGLNNEYCMDSKGCNSCDIRSGIYFSTFNCLCSECFNAIRRSIEGKEVVEMTATDYIYYLTTAFNYNRDTEYMIEVCNRVVYRIDKTHTWRIEHKFDGEGIDYDVDILASAIFVAYGDYGTSPRWGWIEDKGIENAIKTALFRRTKELSFEYMEELLNDT